MTTAVSDVRSNPNDQIDHAAKAIGRSADRAKVFEAICRGKQQIKSVDEIHMATGLSRLRVLQEGKKLVADHIVTQTRRDNDTAYKKDPFYGARYRRILSLARNPARLAKLPTKTRPHTSVTSAVTHISLPRHLVRTKQLTIDDIESFSKVRKIKNVEMGSAKIPEITFKTGIQGIIGEKGKFTDWGGERNDLLSSRVVIRGRRQATAFAFKGPGKKGKLTPRMMGKNGDQIQRLFESTADVFILQYWSQIDESVVKLMGELAKAKSASEGGREILFCVIDGMDSARLIAAYPTKFK
jgi:hypothetical protein